MAHVASLIDARVHSAVRARCFARLVAVVLPLATACFLLTAPTRASARQTARDEPSSEPPALLFSAGWSRSEQSGVWMINSDGSGLGRIAEIGSDPSWSPDGRLIAYVSADHWMIERTDGSGRYRVPLPVGQRASWASGHELLAYRAAAGPGDHSVIYAIDAEARPATRRVLERTLDSVKDAVVESPTGSGYAYGTEVGDVWFTQVPGKPALVSEQPEGTSVLAFSPDGTSIAVARPGPNLTEQIVIVPVDGGHSRTLDMPAIDFLSAAVWSPDGQTLAIAGSTKIVLVPTAGGASFSLHTDDSASPEWSPDGRQLAYVKHGGLWLLNAQTHVSHRLTAANSNSAIAWQPPGSSTAALETATVGAIPEAESSTGRTLETSGIVQEISLHESAIVVDVAASRLHCERLLRWQPGGTIAELQAVGERWHGDGCASAFGVLGVAATRTGALFATQSGGLEISEDVAIATLGARTRTIGRFASTIGGFGTSVSGGQAAAGVVAFATSYVCAGPEITNGGPYRCPRAVPEGTVTRSSLFVEHLGRTVLIRRVPYQMELYDAAPGLLLLAEVPRPTPAVAGAASALIVDPHGRVLHSVALPAGTDRLLFSGRDVVAIARHSLTLLTQTGTTLATDPLPAGGRVAGATAGLAAIVTPSSLRIMRLRDGRAITLLRSTQIHAAASANGIAYSYPIARGSSRSRVVFVPLGTLRDRLR